MKLNKLRLLIVVYVDPAENILTILDPKVENFGESVFLWEMMSLISDTQKFCRHATIEKIEKSL